MIEFTIMTPNYGFSFKPAANNSDPNATGVLYLRIEHSGATRLIPTSYDIRNNEWDARRGVLVISGDSSGRRRKLTECAKSINRNLRLVESIIHQLSRTAKRFSVDDVANAYEKAVSSSEMLGVYASTLSEDLAARGQLRTSSAYLTGARRFIAWRGGLDIDMGAITPAMMRDFQQFLMDDGVSRNSISFYMRTLRAVYNKAVVEGIIPARVNHPFDEVYTDVIVTKTSRKFFQHEMALENA